MHDGEVKYAWQLPAAHTSSTAQMLPHPPQFSGSVCSCARDRHVPLQNCRPSAPQRVSRQAPATQRGFVRPIVVQSVRQAPQWRTSSVRSTQPTPKHCVRPGRHVHAPAVQTCGSAHGMLHPPQASGAVVGATHIAGAPPPAGQLVPVHAQTPALQTSPCAHALAHVPQAVGSVCVFTQPMPGHIVWPAGHEHVPETHD